MTAQIIPNPTLLCLPLHGRERTQKQPLAGRGGGRGGGGKRGTRSEIGKVETLRSRTRNWIKTETTPTTTPTMASPAKRTKSSEKQNGRR